jgi:hypothetical protein
LNLSTPSIDSRPLEDVTTIKAQKERPDVSEKWAKLKIHAFSIGKFKVAQKTGF